MTSGPVSDFKDMLAGMEPELYEEPYLFLAPNPGDDVAASFTETFALIHEEESVTVVARARDALAGGDVDMFARITLQVHSALEGVGLTAAVSTALADAGIACNVIAGFHHDHLFVPWDWRLEALEILKGLSQDARR